MLNIKTALPAWKDYGCISPQSYVVIFFNEQKLFRLSIRLFDEGVCSNHKTWLTHFANSVGAEIAHTQLLDYFDVLARKVQFLGANTPVQTVIDIVAADSVWLMTEQEWLTFVRGA